MLEKFQQPRYLMANSYDAILNNKLVFVVVFISVSNIVDLHQNTIFCAL
jgi:hypothetical protein